MGDDWAVKKIDAWVAQGVLTKEHIMARLDDRIKDSYAIYDEERPVIDSIFSSLQDNTGASSTSLLTKSAFVNLLHSKAALPTSADRDQADRIIYDSIAYLSSLPFPSKSKGATQQSLQGLSREGLVRGLAWALPDRAKSFIEEGPDACSRTEADHHRLIFQSLATEVDGPHVYDSEQSGSSKHDGDGDEIYHDLLDVVYSTQEIKHPGHSPVHRDTLRSIAKKISAENDLISLNKLAIPKDRFIMLTKVLLAMQFDPPAIPSDFNSAAQALSVCFSQGQANSVITWPQFERALRDDAPYLFAPYYRLLSKTFFNKSSTIDVLDASEVPPPPGQDAATLTHPLQSQLSTFLAHSVYFGWLNLAHRFAIASGQRPTPTALLSVLENVPDEAVLVVSGVSVSGERCTFGVFSPRPRSDGTSIQTAHNAGQEHCLLFQLEPMHGVFKGVVGRPGWGIAGDDGNVAFGQGGGVTLVLGDGMRRAVVTHQSTGEGDTATYAACTWRGDWSIAFEVTGIEIWSERET
ncbi:hypothetical protein GGS21DRAFT_187410 [Xylaria nigripes]|nr:hypothetical protein GGS21DRAFT_187410 [Xylaria nigripes]